MTSNLPDDPTQPGAETQSDVGPSETEPVDDLEHLRAEMAEITQKADEYLRLAQRTQADFINYRRRIEEEREAQKREASVGFIQRLLPILDDFERAMANASPQDLESSWGKGLLLVERNLRGLLAADEVVRMDAEGSEFDPRQHEAVAQQPTAEVRPGHVLHVIRAGYRKGERVIRPAQVVVAAAPAASGPAGQS